MKDKAKTALKRFTSGLMAVLLAVCLVGTPKAKAVVSEGALLGSIFGSLLVSMGFSWAAENMDSPSFGEAVYKLIKECDQEMDTGIQLLLDTHLAGLTAVGAGKLTFSHQWIRLANSFCEWFSDKFFANDNTSSVIFDNSKLLSLSSTNSYGTLNYPDSVTITNSKKFIIFEIELDTPGRYVCSKISDFSSKGNPLIYQVDVLTPSRSAVKPSNILEINRTYWNMDDDAHSLTTIWDLTDSDFADGSLLLRMVVASASNPYSGTISPGVYSLQQVCSFVRAGDATLTAEKPAEVHYPDVAEDGSQVYEVTYQGVTATDIEGIIQGAVDRILAGTAAIVGSVEQAGTAEEVTNPEIEPYKVALTSVFPFCIPFDIYNMVTMFVAEPEAPHAEWTFELPWSSQEYSVGWDLSDFDGVAQVCRNMELVLFAVGLAVITYKVIKW